MIKEVISYEKEVVTNQGILTNLLFYYHYLHYIGRIQKMRDENKDIYDIRKQEEGIVILLLIILILLINNIINSITRKFNDGT